MNAQRGDGWKEWALRPWSGVIALAAIGGFVCLAVALAPRDAPPPPPPESTVLPPSAQVIVAPKYGAYTGAYIEFGDTEDDVTLEGIEAFEEKVGKHQAIVAFSSFWGEEHFPRAQVEIVSRHGSAPLIFWSPWDKPYQEELIMQNGPDRFALTHILAGQFDKYIDTWADAARDSRQPIFVSLGNEMNGNWFPWSGQYYGAGEVVPGSSPPRFRGPEMFKRAYKYIVDRVRARGAKNIQWVFHLNNFSEPVEPWTGFSQYYPGPDYVDWLGLSVYGMQYPDGKWEDFRSQVRAPYNELCKLDPNKPIMLTEWGVGEFPAAGSKAGWFSGAFETMESDYPRLHAVIYWNERWQNSETQFYSNLKVDSSPAALEAYRNGVAKPFWLGAPQYR